jgi:putative spermidine/putrescine transport system permease protein
MMAVMMARLAAAALMALNAVTLGVLVVPLVIALAVSLTASDFVGLPTEGLSLRWYRQFFADGRWVPALVNTMATAALTVTIALPLAMLAAIAFSRVHFRGKAVAHTAIIAPLFVPAVVLGLGSLAVHRWLGLWGSPLSMAVAHALYAIPLVFLVLNSTLAGVDRSVEEAAAGLGAGPLLVFREVTLPLVAGGVVVGTLFAFIVSVNELIVSLFLSTPETRTLPVAIWPQLRYMLTPLVAAASAIVMIITLVLLTVAARFVTIRRLLA